MNTLPLFAAPRIDPGALCNPEERYVAGVLNGHVGASMAIKVRDVAHLCGLTTRKAQAIVRHLIVEHRAPIGTGSTGWYLVASPEEQEKVVELHRSRALSELETMAAHNRRATVEFIRRYQTELLKESAA